MMPKSHNGILYIHIIYPLDDTINMYIICHEKFTIHLKRTWNNYVSDFIFVKENTYMHWTPLRKMYTKMLTRWEVKLRVTSFSLLHAFSTGPIMPQWGENWLSRGQKINLTLLVYKAQIHIQYISKYIYSYICDIKISWWRHFVKRYPKRLEGDDNDKKVEKHCLIGTFSLFSALNLVLLGFDSINLCTFN